MLNDEHVSVMPARTSGHARGLMGLAAALAVALAFALSAMWAPSAHASQLEASGDLQASSLQVAGAANAYTQTQLGYQVIPITLQAGAVKLDFAAGASSVSVGIFATADTSGKTTGQVTWIYASDPYEKGTKYGNVAKSGTYYLLFHTSTISGATGSTATITQYPYAKEKAAALNKATLGTSCGDNSTVAYYKISVKKRGYLTLNVADATGGTYNSNVWLCNSKKKSLLGTNNTTYCSADKAAYFGVKKGTYYIAVKSYAGLYNVKPKFAASSTAVKTKKAKAVNIKKGKKMSAVFAAGEKTAWFKFNVTKAKKYTIKLTGKTYNGVRMQFSGDGYYSASSWLYSGVDSKSFKTNKLKPGTYYIQVTSSSQGNGFYTITWK